MLNINAIANKKATLKNNIRVFSFKQKGKILFVKTLRYVGSFTNTETNPLLNFKNSKDGQYLILYFLFFLILLKNAAFWKFCFFFILAEILAKSPYRLDQNLILFLILFKFLGSCAMCLIAPMLYIYEPVFALTSIFSIILLALRDNEVRSFTLLFHDMCLHFFNIKIFSESQLLMFSKPLAGLGSKKVVLSIAGFSGIPTGLLVLQNEEKSREIQRLNLIQESDLIHKNSEELREIYKEGLGDKTFIIESLNKNLKRQVEIQEQIQKVKGPLGKLLESLSNSV